MYASAGEGGEKGIRTLDTLSQYTHFPGVLLQPLGHLSENKRIPIFILKRIAKIVASYSASEYFFGIGSCYFCYFFYRNLFYFRKLLRNISKVAAFVTLATKGYRG